MKWTNEQLAAINSRNCNLLVSAAAGSGKTSVLVERIIDTIADEERNVDIDRLLVVTFTNAAAAEMRERIGKELSGRLSGKTVSRRLKNQLMLLNRSSISTIHSFCLEILRQHFYLLDLDPGFRIADEAESFLLKEDLAEKLLERHYDDPTDILFTRLVDCYGGEKDDEPLKLLILELFDFSRSTASPGEWLHNISDGFQKTYGNELEILPWIAGLKGGIAVDLQGMKRKLEMALALASQPLGPREYLENLNSDISLIEGLINSCGGSWQQMYDAFGTAALDQLKACRNKQVDAELKKRVQDLRQSVKNKLNKIKEDFFFRAPDEIMEDISFIAPLMQKLITLVEEFAEDFKQAKLAKAIIDFNDLEHYTLEILTQKGADGRLHPSAVALGLREKYLEVLVDEYQDINEVQETILKLVSRYEEPAPNFFMVGDPKQSIYRFRLAEPALFQHKYKTFSAFEGARNRRIELNRNFRSRREIINSVNYIFRQIMTAGAGEIAYDRNAELVAEPGIYPPNHADGDHAVELHLITAKMNAKVQQSADEEGEDGENKEFDIEKSRLEARVIAHQIKEMLRSAFLIYDRSLDSCRPVEYRDMAVLLRSTKGWANAYLQEFRRLDIPAYAELTSGYFQASEVETVLSLLKVIDNPRQDIALAAVLRSFIVGLNAEELAQIRLFQKRGDYWEAVIAAAEKGNGEFKEKLGSFVRRLDNWRTIARRYSLTDLIWNIYRETGFYDYVGGLPGGSQRQANLRALYDRAKQYEETSFRGLFRFLRFVENFREKGRDLGEARSLGEKENVVRIMSIHKSKGLEFPVVFVGGLAKRFNFGDLNNRILLHKELGIGPDLVNYELRIKYPTLKKMAIRRKLQLEQLAEEMRVLYVALTRAKEKLFLMASVDDIFVLQGKWLDAAQGSGKTIEETDITAAKSFLDWLGPVIYRNIEESPEQRECLADAPLWKIKYWNNEEAANLENFAVETEKSEILKHISKLSVFPADNKWLEKINKAFNWRYTDPQASYKAAKVTVSDIRYQLLAEDAEEFSTNYESLSAKRPLFMQKERGISATEYGSGVHLLMRHLDLKTEINGNYLEDKIAKMLDKELLTAEQAAAIEVGQVITFFKSLLGRRLQAAVQVFREMPFTLALPAHEIFPELISNQEKVLVQGVVDCLFVEDGQAVIIDYKTGSSQTGQKDSLKEYELQLWLYQLAVEKILKIKVFEKFLYFIDTAETMKV